MQIRIIVCFLLMALSVGCGLTDKQVLKTQSFGAATAKIGKLGEEEFVNIRNSIIHMNKELVAIDNTKNSKSLVFDSPTLAVPTAQRIAACKALNLYGELLVKLVTEDRSEQIQKAANSLIDNTSSALGRELTEEQKGAVGTVIVGLGSFWVEKKKADAAKEIITAYEGVVDDLARLLSKDFSIAPSALGYLDAYLTTARRLQNASEVLVNAGGSYSVLERDRAVQAFAYAKTAITRATELEKRANKTIGGLKKANIELVKVINKREYSTDDIKSYAKQIQELVNIYQVLTN